MVVDESKVDVIIGCPVRHREWILWDWFEYAEKAAQVAGVDASYAFVVNPQDAGVIEVLESTPDSTILMVDEEDLPDVRVWNEDRYEHMAFLRNSLLWEVRRRKPKFFLSLDSDILIHPECLANLIESSLQYDAVGGRTYMSAGRWCPSFSYLFPNGGLNRLDVDDVRLVDVIMGIKLMTPKAYAINYKSHDQGEDIGWSKNCRQNHVSLGVDGRVINKHVMDPAQLHEIDERCGY